MDFKKNYQTWLIPAAIFAGLAFQPVVQFTLNSHSNRDASAPVELTPSHSSAPAAILRGTHTPVPKKFGAETFERLINVSAVRLHPDQWKGNTQKMEVHGNGSITWTPLQQNLLNKEAFSREPILVVFTWGECPTCSLLRKHFETNIDKYPFQILFVPIGNLGDNPKLDRGLIQYLDLESEPEGKRMDALAGGRFASQVLSEQTGSLLVPAFAWRVGNEVGCGNLKGPELDAIIAKMRAVTSAKAGM